MSELLLYYKPSCPYCQRVLGYMQGEGIGIPMKNIDADSHLRKELTAMGGKAQVPCLMIDGKVLYESSDIIEWLKKNYHP